MGRKYKINKGTRRILAAAIFIMLMIIPLFPESKQNGSVFDEIQRVPTYNRHQISEVVPPLVLFTFLFFFTSLVLSWVAAGIIATVLDRAPKRLP